MLYNLSYDFPAIGVQGSKASGNKHVYTQCSTEHRRPIKLYRRSSSFGTPIHTQNQRSQVLNLLLQLDLLWYLTTFRPTTYSALPTISGNPPRHRTPAFCRYLTDPPRTHTGAMQAQAEPLMTTYTSYHMYGFQTSISDCSWDDPVLLSPGSSQWRYI